MPLVVNVVVVGPFEEEEEGIGIASDVIEVEGEDPDLGCLDLHPPRRSRGDTSGTSGDRTWDSDGGR